jgi:hypothetical protein
LFSTVITLALVPCLYLIVEDLKSVYGRAAGLKKTRSGFADFHP